MFLYQSVYDIIGLFFVLALDCTLFLTFKHILISLQIPKVYTSSAIENRSIMFDWMQCILSASNQFLYENISPVNDWRSVQPHRICETAIFNCWRLEFRGRERVAFRKFPFSTYESWNDVHQKRTSHRSLMRIKSTSRGTLLSRPKT